MSGQAQLAPVPVSVQAQLAPVPVSVASKVGHTFLRREASSVVATSKNWLLRFETQLASEARRKCCQGVKAQLASEPSFVPTLHYFDFWKMSGG